MKYFSVPFHAKPCSTDQNVAPVTCHGAVVLKSAADAIKPMSEIRKPVVAVGAPPSNSRSASLGQGNEYPSPSVIARLVAISLEKAIHLVREKELVIIGDPPFQARKMSSGMTRGVLRA